MDAWPAPAADAAVKVALEVFSKDDLVLEPGGTEASAQLLSSRGGFRMIPVEPPFLPDLLSPISGPTGVFCPFPTRLAPLIPLLQAVHNVLPPGGRAVISDLVWQTAPTPELAQAFQPAAGRERVRPIEGYEMQVEHAGFEIERRVDVPPAEWVAFYDAEGVRAAALARDTRGAAKVAVWVLRRS